MHQLIVSVVDLRVNTLRGGDLPSARTFPRKRFPLASLLKYRGQRYHELYAACRREECNRFHAEIPDRDYEWYLRAI
jgi:hypothetical protein